MADVWHALPPETYPITGICVVADKAKCPPGYILVDKTDTGEDADIWKDSFFSRRVTRYFCITRIFPQDYGRINNVLTDVAIVNSPEELPEGFTFIEWTQDSKEKATRKHLIAVKMAPRDSSRESICEIALLSRGKRAPPVGFTLVGDMDGPLFCIKVAPVPSHTQGGRGAASAAPTAAAQTPASFAPSAASSASHPSLQPAQPPRASFAANHTKDVASFLDGVTFSLNSKFTPSKDAGAFEIPHPKFRTMEDIENEFSYPFTCEYQLTETFVE